MFGEDLEQFFLTIPFLFRVINILLGKGYIELEETLLQWKQKSHLMARLEVMFPAPMRAEECFFLLILFMLLQQYIYMSAALWYGEGRGAYIFRAASTWISL